MVAALSTLVVGGSDVRLYALLGAFWLMVLADFPGNRQNRAVAYLGLCVNGLVLITVGTLAAPIPWLAVSVVFLLGVAVTLAGALSETMSAGQRVTLLFYLWPVCTPAGPIGDRLLGWLIAVAICVPASLFLLPPRHHGDLRRHAAQVCTALADRIDGVDSAADVTTAMDALRANFLAANYRPVGLSAGSRALVRVVDHLELICNRVDDDTAAALGPVKQPAVTVLRCCAQLLERGRAGYRRENRAALEQALAQLRVVGRGRFRDDLTEILRERDDAAAVGVGRRLLASRATATTIGLVGRVMLAAAAADARPAWARALGRRLPPGGYADRVLPETVAVATYPTGFLATYSVTARNSLRTGLALALAVTVTHLFPVQHGFWVVLGAMVVLGSSALTTRTKVVQAVVGTAVGVALGSVMVAAAGIHSAVLWCLLPIAIFGCTYLPRLFSFAVTQAMIAMTVLIILNLIAPTGWRIGLLRIEDVAMGAGVGITVSLLLWPKGAVAAASKVINTAFAVNVRYLQAAVLRVTRGSTEESDAKVEARSFDALVASRTVDDAVRQYLSETGSGANFRTPVVRAANRATWVRVAADMIADITGPRQPRGYPRAREVLEAHAHSAANRLAGTTDPGWQPITEQFVLALRAEAVDGADAINDALPLVKAAASLGELELVSPPQPKSAAAASEVVG